jgi:hypothetical protein
VKGAHEVPAEVMAGEVKARNVSLAGSFRQNPVPGAPVQIQENQGQPAAIMAQAPQAKRARLGFAYAGAAVDIAERETHEARKAREAAERAGHLVP